MPIHAGARQLMPFAPRINLLTRVALPIEIVFDMWLQPAHLLRWWAGACGRVVNASVDAQVGGQFWIAALLPNGRGVDDVGTFTTLIRGEVIEAEWEQGSRVSTLVVQLLPLKSGLTEITLTHRDFSDEAARDFQLTRWRAALAAFEAYAAELADTLRR